MANLLKRLELLESRLSVGAIVLTMPDGSQVQLPGGGDAARKLLSASMRGAATPEQQRQLDLIARCESSVESDGGSLVELTRAILLHRSKNQKQNCQERIELAA
jgi:hypothetical protein